LDHCLKNTFDLANSGEVPLEEVGRWERKAGRAALAG
jgi:hypothetical protein